jgi:retron-type reverse transcriptase
VKAPSEKFFDRVNHDKLMGQIANRVEDKRREGAIELVPLIRHVDLSTYDYASH